MPVRSESATGLGCRGRNEKMRGLLVLVQALFLFAVVAAKPKLPSDANKVSIGIDCGSSGSRVCIYYYDQVRCKGTSFEERVPHEHLIGIYSPDLNGAHSFHALQDPHDLVAFEDSCYSIRPGLSSFAGNTQAAGKYLKPLYDHALSLKVPKGKTTFPAAFLQLFENAAPCPETAAAPSHLQRHYVDIHLVDSIGLHGQQCPPASNARREHLGAFAVAAASQPFASTSRTRTHVHGAPP